MNSRAKSDVVSNGEGRVARVATPASQALTRSGRLLAAALAAGMLAGNADAALPEVTVSAATGIGVGAATLNGTLTSDGGSETTVYLCWGTNDFGTASTSAWTVVDCGTKSDGQSFSNNLTGLLYGLRYWYRAYATNAAGEAWSTATNFVTQAPPPDYIWPTYRYYRFNVTANHGNDGYNQMSEFHFYNDNGVWQSSGITYTSSGSGGDGGPGNLGDNNSATKWGVGGVPYWVRFDFGSAKSVASYNWASANDSTPARNPRDWTVQGSTDNSNWVLLDTKTGAVGPSSTFTWSAANGSSFNAFANGGAQYAYPLPSSLGAPAVGITNTTPTAVASDQATLNGTLTGSNVYFDVWAYWGETDGTNNSAAWTNSAYVGAFTLTGATTSSNIAYTASTGIAADKGYWYTLCASNAATNIWAAPSKSFITGEVTVQATDAAAQFPSDTGTYTIYRPEACTNAPLTVYFTMSGNATQGPHYALSPSGSVTIAVGYTSNVVTLSPTHLGVGDAILTLTAERYSVGTASNATITITGSTIPAEIFVATNSSNPEEPYGTWDTAAHDIQTAVDFAASVYPAVSTVTVSNGTYNITAQVNVAAAVTVRSFGNGVYGGLANASNTIVRRTSGNIRIFNITDGNAVLQGLSITNGYNVQGAGVYMTGGVVRDCIIANNNANGNIGGGVYMNGGSISNCIVRSNRSSQGNVKTGHGGGIHATGTSKIFNCQILSNTAANNQIEPLGGGVYADNANVLIRNCLIVGNSAVRRGGGVYLANGQIQNCTIVGNWTTGANQPENGAGGGVYRTGGTIRNSIVYFNAIPAASTTGSTNIAAAAAGVVYTCTTGPVFSGNNCISGDPLFVDRAGRDYTLLEGSPCIDVGENEAWMAGAPDLAGNTRKQWGRVLGSKAEPIVDMGAYEAPEPAPAGTILLLR